MEEERQEGISKRQQAEIESLATKGHVTPEEVVDFASDPSTALHSRFEWDDSVAAAKYRLDQARQVLRAVFTVIEHPDSGTTARIRTYIKLSTDHNNGVGYRRTADVMVDDELLNVALADAQRDFAVFHEKYKDIVALQSVFAAASKVFPVKAPSKRKKAG